MKKLSVIVLVGGKVDLNILKKCLDSVSWADEIIKVETEKLKGNFSDWRNYGAEKSEGEWLLYIDADETITLELKEEILRVINNQSVATKKYVAYAIPRHNNLLGHFVEHGGWWPDNVLRLIKKDSLIGWRGGLHEQPEVNGAIGRFKHPLIHYTHRSIFEMIEKTNKWSDIEARLLFDSNHPPMTWWRFLSAGFREFWFRAILKLGFLDGTVGFIEVIYQMFSRWVTYTKLWELQIRDTRNQKL